MSGIEPWIAAMAAPAGGTAAAAGTAAAGSAAATAAGGALAGGATAAGLESLAAGSFATSAATIEAASAAAGGGLAGGAAAVGKELGKGAALAGAANLLAPKPTIPGAVRPVTRDDARQRAEMQDRLAKKKGNAASVLTGKLGDTTPPLTAAKQLLGQ